MPKRYWLKLQEHFFESDEVVYLESQPGGDKYVSIWLKLLLKALRPREESACGVLRFNDELPYSPELLATSIRCDRDTLLVALELFKRLKMIRIMDDGTIYIEAVQAMIGSESDSAERVRRFRERQLSLPMPKTDKPLQGNVALQSNGGNEIGNDIEEAEVEREEDKERDIGTRKPLLVDPKSASADSGKSRKKGRKAPAKEEDPARKDLYHRIEEAFQSKHPYEWDFKREGPAIKRIVESAFLRPDPVEFTRKAINGYWRRINDKRDRLFYQKPFIPSVMRSAGMWPVLTESIEQATATTREQDILIGGLWKEASGES